MEQLLDAINYNLNLMLGGNGTIGITTVAVTDARFRVIRFNEDSVITVLEDMDGNNLLTDLNLGTTTWGAGTLIKAPNNTIIKKITLSSGSGQGIQ